MYSIKQRVCVRGRDRDWLHAQYVRQLLCVCISKRERDYMCLLGCRCLYTWEGVIPWERHLREHTCASWTVNTSTYAHRRPACWNIDGNLPLWRNTSSVTLKVRWIFQWPGGVGILGVKLEGNHWTILGISLQNGWYTELPFLSSASRHFSLVKNELMSRQSKAQPQVGLQKYYTKTTNQNAPFEIKHGLRCLPLNTPYLFHSEGNREENIGQPHFIQNRFCCSLNWKKQEYIF